MHLPLKHKQSMTSAFQMEKVNCFLFEDVWSAQGAKSLTFPSLPMALIWSHGDLAFYSASSQENVKNFEKASSSQVLAVSTSTVCGAGNQNIHFIHSHQITSNRTWSKWSNMN